MSRRYNRAPVEQAKKPTFNVVKPFQGITTIQLNSEMAKQLAEFLAGFDGEDLEQDLIDLTNQFEYYSTDSADNSVEPSFIESERVDQEDYERGSPVRIYSLSRPIGGVFSVSVNEPARQLLIEVISECEGQVDRIVWAFRLALEDPTGGPREPREARGFRPKRYPDKRYPDNDRYSR